MLFVVFGGRDLLVAVVVKEASFSIYQNAWSIVQQREHPFWLT